MYGIVGVDTPRTLRLASLFGGRAEFDLHRLDILGFSRRGALGRFDIATLRSTGEQKTLQHHGAKDAPLHMSEDAPDVVRAETGGQYREMGMVGPIGEDLVQMLAVAEENANNTQDRGDAGGHGGASPVLLWGGRGRGACGM